MLNDLPFPSYDEERIVRLWSWNLLRPRLQSEKKKGAIISGLFTVYFIKEILTLKGGTFVFELFETVSWAKVLILSRTTAIPLSSEALSSRILERHKSPNKSLAAAKIVDVLPT